MKMAMEMRNCYEVCVFEYPVNGEPIDGDYRTIGVFDGYDCAQDAYYEACRLMGTTRDDSFIIDGVCIYEYDEKGLCEPIRQCQ